MSKKGIKGRVDSEIESIEQELPSLVSAPIRHVQSITKAIDKEIAQGPGPKPPGVSEFIEGIGPPVPLPKTTSQRRRDEEDDYEGDYDASE